MYEVTFRNNRVVSNAGTRFAKDLTVLHLLLNSQLDTAVPGIADDFSQNELDELKDTVRVRHYFLLIILINSMALNA